MMLIIAETIQRRHDMLILVAEQIPGIRRKISFHLQRFPRKQVSLVTSLGTPAHNVARAVMRLSSFVKLPSLDLDESAAAARRQTALGAQAPRVLKG